MLFDLRGRGRRRTVQVDLPEPRDPHGGRARAVRHRRRHERRPDRRHPGQLEHDERDRRVPEARGRAREAHAGQPAGQRPPGRSSPACASSSRAAARTTTRPRAPTPPRARRSCCQAAAAWQRHLRLAGEKPDTTVANQMVQAYGITGLRNYAEAVKALEFVIDATPNATFQQYAQLAVLAHGAKQTRKATLSADKAVSLAPKNQRKTLRRRRSRRPSSSSTRPPGRRRRASSAAVPAGPAAARGRSRYHSRLVRPCSSTGRAADS